MNSVSLTFAFLFLSVYELMCFYNFESIIILLKNKPKIWPRINCNKKYVRQKEESNIYEKLQEICLEIKV